MGMTDPDYGTDKYVDIDITMHPSWGPLLISEFDKPYMQRLYTHIQEGVLAGEEVPAHLFSEFREKTYDDVYRLKVRYEVPFIETSHAGKLILVGIIFGKRNKDWDRFLGVVNKIIEEKNGRLENKS